MSLWSRLSDVVQDMTHSVSHYFEALIGREQQPEKTVTFTIGMIALGAKMAKADGVVTEAEFTAFKEVFQVPEKEMPAVMRIFDLAKQDIAGFETYAEQVGKLLQGKADTLENVLDGLFHIATSDGAVHEDELTFLERVSEIFGFNKLDFARIRSHHVHVDTDPYEILGLPHEADIDAIKAKHRALVRELHPDKLIAAGVPPELIQLSTDRLARINEAYDRITKVKHA